MNTHLHFRFCFLLCIITILNSSCDRNNIKEIKSWQQVYQSQKIDTACMEIADYSHERIYYTNLYRCGKRVSPASTFKIVLSLIALETGIAPDEDLVIKWNGKKTGREAWDKDMDMRTAFKCSSEPYYKEIAKRIGRTELQKWLDTLRYGNKLLGDSIQNSWTNNTLQISPDEQVGFMSKLYYDKLPMSKRAQRIVRSFMLFEDSTRYKLYYKTGTYMDNDTAGIWLVGFIEKKETTKNVETKQWEENNRPYFFAQHYVTTDTSLITISKRVSMAKEVFKIQKIIH